MISFRPNEEDLKRLEWLERDSGVGSATAVLRSALKQAYDERMAFKTAKEAPIHGNGRES